MFYLLNEGVVPAGPSGGRAIAKNLISDRVNIDIQPFVPVFNREWERLNIQEGVFVSAAVGRGTGPTIVRSTPHYPGPNRVLFDVADCGDQVSLVQKTREGTFLPKMADKTILAIEPLRMGAIDAMKHEADRIQPLRYCDVVHMICHETVRQDS